MPNPDGSCHFVGDLESVEEFLIEADAPGAFSALLDDLFKETIPALERYPDLGTDFFHRPASSREASELESALRFGSQNALRELICGDTLSSTPGATTISICWPSSTTDNFPSILQSFGNNLSTFFVASTLPGPEFRWTPYVVNW